ncbi:MAG: hypothetical protein L0H73_15975 [Nitrococcus sp.]|nr:hypothetical protein [Nitrococcus sp.]
MATANNAHLVVPESSKRFIRIVLSSKNARIVCCIIVAMAIPLSLLPIGTTALPVLLVSLLLGSALVIGTLIYSAGDYDSHPRHSLDDDEVALLGETERAGSAAEGAASSHAKRVASKAGKPAASSTGKGAAARAGKGTASSAGKAPASNTGKATASSTAQATAPNAAEGMTSSAGKGAGSSTAKEAASSTGKGAGTSPGRAQ